MMAKLLRALQRIVAAVERIADTLDRIETSGEAKPGDSETNVAQLRVARNKGNP